MDQLWVTMKNTMRWQLTSSALHGFMGGVQTAYGYAQDLNESLNNIRVVTEKSADDMRDFVTQANKAAKALNTTTIDYADASLIYYQQGLNDQQVEERTNATIKFANVSRQSAEIASEQLTSIWNNFYDGSKSLEYYIDVMVKLGAATASSSEEISQGVQKFAATADTIGLSYEYAAAALATVTATTRQSADVVGTAFKTLFARIQDLELGKTLDDGTTLGTYSKALEAVGINIKDANGGLKDMDILLEELGNKWHSIGEDQQVALAQQVAGVRQYTQLMALMENWDFFQENLATAYGSEGELSRQAEIYAESWEAARDRVDAAAEDIYDSVINPDLFIGIDNVATPVLTVIADIIDGLGGLQGILSVVGLLMNKVYGDKLAQSMRDVATNLDIIRDKEAERTRALQHDTVEVINSLTKVYAANSAEQAKLNILREEVQLRGIINSQYDKLDNQQKQIVDNELYQLEIIKTQNLALAERVGKLISSTQEKEDTIVSIETRNINQNWQTELRNEIQAWNTSHSQKYQLNLNIRANSNIDIVTAKILTELKTLAGERAKLSQLNNEFQKLDSSSTNYLQNMRDLWTSYYTTANVSQTDVGKMEQMFKDVATQARNTGSEIAELGQLLKMIGHNPQMIDSYVVELQQLAASTDQSERIQELYNQKIKEFTTLLQQGIPVQKDWADNLVKVGTTLSQVTMGLNAISSMMETFKEGEFTVDSFVRVLTNLSTLLPVISSLANKNVLTNGIQAISYLTAGASAKTAAAGITTVGTAINMAIPVIGLIVIALGALASIISAIVVSEEEARDKINEATEAYKEQKNALQSLNDELKTTQDRIEELNNQETLSIVEQEELDKLLLQEESLKRQVELQEKLTNAALKTQAKEIEKNYAKSTKSLSTGPDTSQYRLYRQDNGADEWYAQVMASVDPDDIYMQAEYKRMYEEMLARQWVEGYVDADTWFNSVTQGLDKTSDAYQDYLVEYQQWKVANEQITAEWAATNSEAIQQAESDYLAYIEAIQSGAIDYDSDTIASMQANLQNIRKNLYSSEGEYEQAFLQPLLENAAIENIQDSLYATLLNAGAEEASQLFDGNIQKIFDRAGISTDEFLTWLDTRIDETKEQVASIIGVTEEDLAKLTSEDWEILTELNFENIDTADELWEALEQYKNNDVNIRVSVDGIETLKQVLEELNEQENPLESAISSYKDQGYLSMDQVQELIAANSEYAKYIVKVGDAYKLTNQAIYDFLDLEAKEAEALDETLGLMKDKTVINTDYVQNYINTWDELVTKATDWQSYTFVDEADATRFIKRTAALKENAEAYQAGTISAKEYFDTIGERIDLINAGFHRLDEEIEDNIDETNLYEATMSAATGSIADGLTDLNKKFKQGQVNMDDYYEGTISGAKALIKIQAKQNKNIEQNSDGTWKLNDGIDATTVSAEEYSQALADINQLNAWEEQVKQAEGMLSAVNTLTDNYDYLLQYATAFGEIDFNVDNNFDTTATEFQNLCDSMSQSLVDMQTTNADAYRNVISAMIAAGAELDTGVAHNAEELSKAMASDVAIAEAAINTTMSESGNTISNVSQAAGKVISALGDLISNFSYELSFTPYVKSCGKLQIEDWLAGEATLPFELPTIGMKVSGSGGEGVSDFVSALTEAGNYLSSQGTGTGQGGIFDYGVEPYDFNPYEPADPEDIETDNLRDKENGGGTSYDAEDEKQLKDIEDRYHEINREIQYQESILEDLDEQIDRTYGTKRLDLYKKSIAELTRQAANQAEKLREAQEDYLPKDTQAVIDAFGIDSVVFKENGEIANYNALLKQTVDDYNNGFLADYNAFLLEYSALTKEEQEARKAEYESWQAAKELAEATYERRQAVLQQYEKTLDTIQETKDAHEDLMRQIEDEKLNEITYKLEIVLDVKDAKDAAKEFAKTIVESFGDELTHGLGSAEIGYDQALLEQGMYDDYLQQYNDLKQRMAEANEYTDTTAIVDAMKDLQSNIIGSGESLLEWIETVETMLPNAIDAARERFNLFTDQLEHNSTVLDTVKELLALQGYTYKTMEGFSALQKTIQEQMDASLANAELNKAWFERARADLLKAEEALAGVKETDVAYDTLKNNRDALLAEYNEAQEAMLSSAAEAMEAAKEMYVTAIERAAYDFDQALSGGMGLDLLQDKYDHLIEEEERYLDAVNEAYEVSSWYTKLQADIDKATNSAYKERLKELQEEIDIRREGNTLSEYDLSILEAKYKVLQAQMALEDAQNAKSELRLVRDSQGNWNYQYTADPEQIAAAEQELMDAQNEYYNIAKEQVKEVTGEIIATWQECNEKIKEIYLDETLTVEEREAAIAEIRRYYSEKILDLEEEKNIALSDMTEAGGEIIAKYGNTYDEVLGLMETDAKDFESAFETALSNMETAMGEYENNISNAAETTGTSYDDLRQVIDDVSTSTDNCRDAGLDAANAMWDTIDAVQNASMSYIELAQSIMQTVYALQELATAQAMDIETYSNSSTAGIESTLPEVVTPEEPAVETPVVTTPTTPEPSSTNTVSHGEMVQLVYDMGQGDYNNNPLRKQIVEGKYPGLYSTAQSILNDAIAQDRYNYDHNGAKWKQTIDDLVTQYGFASGGYTGDFQDAKLAFLHEKELVLNKYDTSNILSAVSAVRSLGPEIFAQIERMLDGTANAGLALMADKLSSTGSPIMVDSGTVEQLVRIEHVEFPNVTSSDEISDAFASLVNDASQWAQRRRD